MNRVWEVLQAGARMLPEVAALVSLSGHTLACLAGLLLSAYALYVERMRHSNPKYVAACDFNEHMNCSKVLTSEYSKGFGLVKHLVGEGHFLNLPNCLTGILFYLLQLALVPYVMVAAQCGGSSLATQALFASSVASCIGCLYLAYILAFVLKDFCVVCVATYVVNFYLLYDTYYRLY